MHQEEPSHHEWNALLDPRESSILLTCLLSKQRLPLSIIARERKGFMHLKDVLTLAARPSRLFPRNE